MKRRDFIKTAAGAGLAAGLGWPEAQAAHHEAEPALTESRRAYRELLEVMREAEQRYLGPEWRVQSPVDVAEGTRFLTHVFSTAIELFAENHPARPRMAPYISPTRKLLGDNPDAVYFLAVLHGESGGYRIRGNTSGAVYTSFTFQTGNADGIADEIFATRNDRQFDVAPDGSYELIVKPGATGPNGIDLHPEAVSVTTRHYFENELSVQLDPGKRVEISIEPLVDHGPPPPPSDAEIAQRLRRARGFIHQNTLGSPLQDPAKAPPFVGREVNQFGTPVVFSAGDSAWGAVDNAYAQARYALEPDQALLIDGRMPDCTFSNLVLWNRFLQTHDYVHRRVSLNRKQITFANEGRFRIVLAHRDPGVANWIDAGGRTSGLLFWRFMLPTESIDPLQTRVVAVDAVKGA